MIQSHPQVLAGGFTHRQPGAIKDGLGFSTKNGLPASNGDFGARNVEYYFNTSLHDFAPVEIFYAATAQTHPVGNTKFCADNAFNVMTHQYNDYLLSSDPFISATPNWFHYYSQAYSSPVAIAYDDEGYRENGQSTGQSYYDRGQMQEITVNADRTKDWADDGLNHGTVPGPDPANRHLITH